MATDPKTGERIRVHTPTRPSLPGEDIERARTAILERVNRDERTYIGWLVVYDVERTAGELDVYFLYCYEAWANCQSGSDVGEQIVKSGRATVRGAEVVTCEVREEGSDSFGEWEHDHGDWDSGALPERVRRRLEAARGIPR